MGVEGVRTFRNSVIASLSLYSLSFHILAHLLQFFAPGKNSSLFFSWNYALFDKKASVTYPLQIRHGIDN